MVTFGKIIASVLLAVTLVLFQFSSPALAQEGLSEQGFYSASVEASQFDISLVDRTQEGDTDHSENKNSCSNRTGLEFELTNEYEEENLQRAINNYTSGVLSQGCFPCCFCCNKGSCCDSCKKRNNLTTSSGSNSD